MSNLDTIQSVGEATWKAFEKIDNKEKKEWFSSLIDEFESNEQITKLKCIWNWMTEKQKEKLYQKWAITFTHVIINWSPVFTLSKSAINAFINTKNNGIKNATKYAFLEQIPCRFLVELWIFDKPEWLSNQQLIEDVRKDAKNYHLYLWIAEAACAVIPDAQAAVPFISMARTYTKWYKEHWTEVIIDKLREQKENKIKKDTSEALLQVLNEDKKAA